MHLMKQLKFIYSLKWIIAALLFALFCRIFFISVYKISTESMNPKLLSGDIIVANQLSYGFRLPWMQTGYFESEPEVGDIVVYKVKKTIGDDILIKRIDIKNTEVVKRDQIIGKAWFVALSVGTTQDSISEEKSIRWNRFLTLIH